MTSHRRTDRINLPIARLAAALLFGGLATAQTTVRAAPVPSAALTPNGNAAMALPGFPEPLRLQLLIDQTQLQPLVGHTIAGLRFRRQQHPRPFASGQAIWTISLSLAAVPAAQASPSFGANNGPSPIALPLQSVQAPVSPGVAAPWDPSNTVQVPCPPLLYNGGTLCIDIAGRPDPTQLPVDWPVDAEQLLHPTPLAITTGPGCGIYGSGDWSFVETESLVVGETTHFSAFGTPGGMALLLVDTTPVPFAFDLSTIGAAPGCHLHMTTAMLQMLTTFSPPVIPTDPSVGGMAVIAIEVPRQPWLLGTPFTEQWIDLYQPAFAASAAHGWSVAATLPGAGFTTIVATGGANAPTGEVIPDFLPVLQILY